MINSINTFNNRIDKLNNNLKTNQNISFGSTRTDRNLVEELTRDSGSLFKPKERKIQETIERLSNDSSSDNIKFLLNVANNLKYGLRNGSEVTEFINNESNISEKQVKQNVNWELILQNAIKKALGNNNEQDKTILEKEFNNIFGANNQANKDIKPANGYVWLSVNADQSVERNVISHRNSILNSDEIKKSSDKKNVEGINKHIDYFIASSEVSIEEKEKCLRVLADFIRDNYKINEQLQDKKVQILSELLNDLVVKTPESPVLTIKKLNQKSIGMCAAISTGSKSMAHEKKYQHVCNILALLDNKSTMEVYDVTSSNKEEKITLQKADVDYKDAISRDYRIIDAAITNYMHFSDQSGNGLNKSGKYIPYDAENYGLFDDSHLLVDMDEDHQPKFKLLMATLKLKKLTKSIKFSLEDLKHSSDDLKNIQKPDSDYNLDAIYYTDQIKESLTKMAKKSGASVSDSSINTLALVVSDPKRAEKLVNKKIDRLVQEIESVNSEDKKVELRKEISRIREEEIINPNESLESKKVKIANIINSQIPGLLSDRKDSNLEDIVLNYDKVAPLRSKEEGLSKKFSLKGRYKLQTKLFELAAFNRVKKEYETEIPERLESMAKQLRVPVEKEAVLRALENRGEIFSRNTLDKIYNEIQNISLYKSKDLQKGDQGWISDSKLYAKINTFNEEFKEIKESLNSISREVKRDFKVLDNDLDGELTKIFDINARGTGDYWTGYGGDSGLDGDQYTRLKMQLCGDNHRLVTDPKEFVEQTRDAAGGIISATHVSDSEFSAHAQYGYDAKVEDNTINPETGKVEKSLNYYNDNSWGPSENLPGASWKDDAGHLRTDYGSGYGYKNGYLLDSSLTQGNDLLTFVTGTGVHKPSMVGKEWAKKYDSSIGQEYPLFMDGVVQGNYNGALDDAISLVDDIIGLSDTDTEDLLDNYFERLEEGNIDQISDVSRDINTSLLNIVNKHLDSNSSRGLKQEVSRNIVSVISKYPPALFKAEAVKTLQNKVSKFVAEKFNEFNQNLPLSINDKMDLIEEIEEKVNNEILEASNPAPKIDKLQLKLLSKNTEVIYDKLIAEIRGNKLNKVLGNPDADLKKASNKKGIQTREEYDSLPDSSLIKLLLNKIALKKYAFDDEVYIKLDGAKSLEDIETIKKEIINKRKDNIVAYFESCKKTPEGAYKELKETHLGVAIIHWIDEKFNPKSDAELLSKIGELSKASKLELRALLSESTPEDLSVNFTDPYYLLQKIRGLKESTLDKFKNAVYSHLYQEQTHNKTNKDLQKIISEHKEWLQSEEARELKPEERKKRLQEEIENYYDFKGDLNIAYKNIKMSLEEVEMEKIIKKEKTESINKYNVRPTFPVLKVISDEGINNLVTQTLDDLEQKVSEYREKSFSGGSTEEKQALVEDIKVNKKIFVKGFTRPRHQDDMMSLVNAWVKEVSKHPGSSNATELRTSIESRMMDDFILKHPVELLDYVSQVIPKQVNSGKPLSEVDEMIRDIWKDHLNKCLKTAKKVEIESDIRSYISEAKMPQIARKLRETKMLGSAKVDEGKYLENEDSAKFIFTVLGDTLNNNSTLKYFIEQAGLTKSYAKIFMSDNWNNGDKELAIIPESIINGLNDINTTKSSYEEIQNSFEDFVYELSSNPEYAENSQMTFDDLKKILKKVLFKALDQKIDQNAALSKAKIDSYKDTLLGFIDDIKNQEVDDEPLALLLELQESLNQSFDQNIELLAIDLSTKVEVLRFKLEALNVINELVPGFYELKTQINNKQSQIQNSLTSFEKQIELLPEALKSKFTAKRVEELSQSPGLEAENEQFDNEETQAAMQKTALDVVSLLSQAVKSENESMIGQVMDMINSLEMPVMNEVLASVLLKSDESKELKYYCAEALADKAEIAPLAIYVQDLFDKNDNIPVDSQDDKIIMLTLESLSLDAESCKEDNEQLLANTLYKLFDFASRDESGSELARDINMFILKELPNEGLKTREVFFELALDPEVHVNTRYNSLQFLSNEDTLKYYDMFKSILLEPKAYADTSTDMLILMNSAAVALNKLAYSFEEYNMSELASELASVNVDKALKSALKEGLESKEELISYANILKETIENLKELSQKAA